MQVSNLRKSTQKHKKYVADVLMPDGTLYKNIHFGDVRYQHYRDQTHLKLYSHLDHNDWKRKQNFHARHKHNNKPAALLSKEYLW